MQNSRCPHCHLPVTTNEVRTGSCPWCDGAFHAQPAVVAAEVPVKPRSPLGSVAVILLLSVIAIGEGIFILASRLEDSEQYATAGENDHVFAEASENAAQLPSKEEATVAKVPPLQPKDLGTPQVQAPKSESPALAQRKEAAPVAAPALAPAASPRQDQGEAPASVQLVKQDQQAPKLPVVQKDRSKKIAQVPAADQPIPLPILAKPPKDRASLADPTLAASVVATMGKVAVRRAAPVPFAPINLPDPFEHSHAVRLRHAVEELPTPPPISPRTPAK